MKFVTVNNGWQFLNLPNLNIYLNNNLYLAIDLFWDLLFTKLQYTSMSRVVVILRVKISNGKYVTIVPIQIIDKSNKALFTKIVKHYIYLIKNNYSSLDITNVIFQYILLDNDTNKQLSSFNNLSISSYYFGTYNLPLTTDLNKWGKITKVGNDLLIKSDKYESDIKVFVHKDLQTYEFILDNKIILTVTDFFGSSHDSFIRTINNQTFIINHGKVTYYSIIKYIIKSISIFYKGKYIINYILNIIGYILFEIILTLFLIFNCLIYLAVIQTIILFIIDLLS